MNKLIKINKMNLKNKLKMNLEKKNQFKLIVKI